MIKYFLLLLPFVCIPSITIGQAKPYALVKIDNVIELRSKSDTIIFQEYRKTDDRGFERRVLINKALYKFKLKITNQGRVQSVVDSSGNPMATVLLSGESRNSIVFPDGKKLKWQQTGKTSWGYFYKDVEVAGGTYYKEDQTKMFVVQQYDSTFGSSVLTALSLEYGANNSGNMNSKRRTVVTMVGVACGVALVRLAAGSSDD